MAKVMRVDRTEGLRAARFPVGRAGRTVLLKVRRSPWPQLDVGLFGVCWIASPWR
jgi:hypothetical protein